MSTTILQLMAFFDDLIKLAIAVINSKRLSMEKPKKRIRKRSVAKQ